LFVVGDPKQSIYRFRRADINIYNEVRARLEASPDGDVLPLTSNFRTVPALCEWANDVFSTQFPSTPTTQSPRFARLESVNKVVKGPSGLLTLTIPATVAKAADIPAYEAATIARYIQSEVNTGRRKFGDFLILTRKKKDIKTYAVALEDQQVPVEVSGAGAFGSSQEVQHLTLLLRALADPQDGVSLVGVLRGPLFGISDRSLFAYRQAGGWFGIFAEAPKSEAASVARVVDAIAALRRMHRWTQVLPVGAAVERILENSGYLALAATTPGGVEAGDLLHAVDRVRSIVESGFTLADAADALEPDADEPSDVESLPLEPGRDDVVRLMNLHKAKGLEAPVVFLVDPLSGVSARVDVRIIREGAKARGYFKITDSSKSQKVVGEPPDWDQYEAEELAYLKAEEKRLLYVAATRAKEMLVLSRSAKSAEKGPWGVFEGFLTKAQELKVPSTVASPVAHTVDLSAPAAAEAIARAEDLHLRALKASWASASVTSESKAFPKLPVVAAAADDPTGVVSADTPSRRADAGAAWGSLIHGLLEHALRHQQATREDLQRLAMWLTVDEPRLRPLIDEAVATVQAVAKKEFWAEAKASPECHEEVPFAIRGVDEKTGVPKILNGTIDSVFRQGADWKIVDYKTDVDGSDEVLQARYGAQLAAYVAAWRQIVNADAQSVIVPARIAAVPKV
jgi:ATP-dependent helicase/nuclease subunit A